MFEHIKAKMVFGKLLARPNINNAYKMVGPEDSWYNTIKTVHESLDQIQQLPHEIIEIKGQDGVKLKAIYYPAANPCGKTVICVHGYTSHAEREWAFPGLFYHSLGFNLLIPYQRAHGISEGKRITFGALERGDMIRWVEKINSITPSDGILIHGLSMGGLIALLLADAPLPSVKAIISDAPSQSIDSFFTNISNGVFKQEGATVAEWAMKDFEKYTGFDPRNFKAVDYVKKSVYPILLSAGELENQEEYFALLKEANPMPTEIIILPGCNHGNGMYKQTALYQDKIRNFISLYM